MKDIKVLLVYVNSMMDNLIPLNISYLTACLREKGIDVSLFDTTFYRTADKSSDEARVEMLQVKPFDISKYGVSYKTTDVFEDFKKIVNTYRPTLICFSVVEPTYMLSEKLLDSIEEIKGESKVIFGGIFAIFAYSRIINHKLIDMVCFGEGEKALVEVCENIAYKKSMKGIKNLIVKEDGQIFHNPKASLVDLNYLPYLDFSLFEKERFFKPIGGKVLKMVPVEFARGCPYKCTYCANPSIAQNFEESGVWLRHKSVKRIIKEIEFYLTHYNVEYFYFIHEAFLCMNKKDFDEFVSFYKDIRIPFWLNTRIETITPERLERLEKINCNRISIGLESGSEILRKRLLKRNYTNDYFIKKFRLLSNYKISVSVNNIIGFPDETREQIFDTISINREINAESFGAYVFQPYYGTTLRDYCVKKEYITEDFMAGDAHLGSGLSMPQLSSEEINGLQRTFSLYVRLPEKYYSDIRIAEGFDEEGNKMFKALSEKWIL